MPTNLLKIMVSPSHNRIVFTEPNLEVLSASWLSNLQIREIDKKHFLMKKIEFFDKKNNLFKILDIPDHVKNGDYWTAIKMTMFNVKKSHSTELEILKVDYDQDLKDNIFSESYLKRQ